MLPLLSASNLSDNSLVYDYVYILQSRMRALRKYKKYMIIKIPRRHELTIKYPISTFIYKTHNSVAYADANISSWNISYSRNEIFLPIYAIFFMLLSRVILFSLISEASNKALSKQTLRLQRQIALKRINPCMISIESGNTTCVIEISYIAGIVRIEGSAFLRPRV